MRSNALLALAILLALLSSSCETTQPLVADQQALELVIDPSGSVVFYQGHPGEHRSVRSANPVADGAWHHVAVAHDPERGWTRLSVDGEAADSLYSPVPIRADTPDRVALGRRPVPDGVLFDGEMDELRLWAVARTHESIRNTMARPLPQPQLGPSALRAGRNKARGIRIHAAPPVPAPQQRV